MVLGVTESAAALRGLQERFPDFVSLDEAERARLRTDYGRWVFKEPGAVARPAAGITFLVWRPAGPMRWPVS